LAALYSHENEANEKPSVDSVMNVCKVNESMAREMMRSFERLSLSNSQNKQDEVKNQKNSICLVEESSNEKKNKEVEQNLTTVYISNVPPTMNKNVIKQLFGVSDTERVFYKKQGNLYAITYETSERAKNALRMNGLTISNHIMKVELINTDMHMAKAQLKPVSQSKDNEKEKENVVKVEQKEEQEFGKEKNKNIEVKNQSLSYSIEKCKPRLNNDEITNNESVPDKKQEKEKEKEKRKGT